MHHYGTPGVFWTHALFSFLEDRLESEALVELATESLCREVTLAETVDAIQRRMGRPLEDVERRALLMASDQAAAPRVFSMLDSDALWASLIQAGDTCVAVFHQSAE